jgi:hypothetical protein
MVMTVKILYQEPGRAWREQTEQKLFSREDLEALTKEEIIHLYADSHIFGWTGVENQKKYNADQTARGSWGCWECSNIFRKWENKPPEPNPASLRARGPGG